MVVLMSIFFIIIAYILIHNRLYSYPLQDAEPFGEELRRRVPAGCGRHPGRPPAAGHHCGEAARGGEVGRKHFVLFVLIMR